MDWILIILIAIAVFITGISKGGFSGAFGVIAVPLISLKTSPVLAAAIMLPILCIMDIFTVQKFWRGWDVPTLKQAIPAALVGVVIGTLTASWFSVAILKILLGTVAIIFALLSYPRASRHRPLKPLGRLATAFWCALGGFTSFVAHSGGPPFSVYLLRTNLDKTKYVASAAVIFIVINYVKIVPYALLNQFNIEIILMALAFVPIAYAGVHIGVWLHYRIHGPLFFKMMYVLLFVTGVKLLWDGVQLV